MSQQLATKKVPRELKAERPEPEEMIHATKHPEK